MPATSNKMATQIEPVIAEGRPLRAIVIFAVIWLASIGVLILSLPSSGVALRSPGGTYIVLFYSFLGVIFGTIVYRSIIRAVVVSASGVVFVTSSTGVPIHWPSLEPPSSPASFGQVSFYYHLEDGVRRRMSLPLQGFDVTVFQARAILSHPSCPKWDLGDDIRRSLSL